MKLRERSLVFFDLETTGLNPWRGDRLIEIGAVRSVNQAVTETFSVLVNPLRPIPPEVSSVHGITDEDVRGAATQDDVIPKFIEFIGEDVLLAHNASFDIGFLSSALKDLGMPIPENIVVDTLTLSRKLFPEYDRHSLDILRERYALASGGFHRATRDAADLQAIFGHFLEKMEAHGLCTLKDLLAIHGPAFSFDPRELEPDIYPPQLFEALTEAKRSQRSVRIAYSSNGGFRSTTRVVDPYKIVKLGGHDYMVGFCHMKGDKRNFRLDRITSWQITSDTFEQPQAN